MNDPAGFIMADAQAQVPFELNETDIEATVVLMTDIPVVDIAVATPAGQVTTPGIAVGMNVTYVRTSSVRYYRFMLPVANGRRRADGQVGGAAYAKRAAT